jgi:hypothetical protein
MLGKMEKVQGVEIGGVPHRIVIVTIESYFIFVDYFNLYRYIGCFLGIIEMLKE